jgi:galactose-1-phosphate uridylyltransferase
VAIIFKKEEETFVFYDNDGNKTERKTEIRFDPLTGETSRLVFDPGLHLTPADYTEAAEQTGGLKCPFCPENILKLTPVFPKEVAESGRIVKGEATVFPNLFPYSKHNGVVVFSREHYVRLEEFTPRLIKDAFMAAQTYIQRVASVDPKAKYASINWNYLPTSGGSIIHPHLHVVVSESGTNYQTHAYEKAAEFEKETGKEYFAALYEAEKAIGERWIGEKGDVAWMHAYAPKSHHDYIAVFRSAHSFESVTEGDWDCFAEGLLSIFASMAEEGFSSFNFVLSADPEEKSPIHARLIPRFTMGALHTSDINFFQALHQEPLSYKVPEEVAAKARGRFSP